MAGTPGICVRTPNAENPEQAGASVLTCEVLSSRFERGAGIGEFFHALD